MSQGTHHPISKAVAFAIIIAAISAAGYVAFSKVEGLVDKLSRAISGAIGPVTIITEGERTILKADQSKRFLITHEKNFEHTHTWTHTWAKSTKEIILKGHFSGQAGYDLTKPFSIEISPDGKKIRAKMPKPELGPLSLTKVEVIKDEAGWWNGITGQDRQDAHNKMLAEAKGAFSKTSILEDAEKSLMKQLEEIVHREAPPDAEIIRDPLP